MIEDIISKLFPHFAKKKENKQKIGFMGKRFRKVFDGWRRSEEVDDDKTACRNFFIANTDLYTINLDFACTDKIDVTRSKSFPEDDDEKDDNDEREQRKHKKK
ncbi:unnamed protein product [Rhizophagus irregularis]|uniref:Uncharacterized protein n=1 Tax=Rhizophagus irregularis TaxID=588596 RepID=A0A916E0Z4_9GLOM|nr:unnamed protein product [Rhizophagus irregularis]